MKNVYFVQPNNELSKLLYLPYAVGAIAAYTFSHSSIKEHYNLCDFIFRMMPIEEAVEDLKTPYIVGFSNYMWNIRYNLCLAEKIKERWPDCIIVFGGPHIPDNTEYLEKYNFIDITINGEGEIPFHYILTQKMLGEDMSEIPNISYREGEKIIKTRKDGPWDLTDFPSPYEMGLFDSIIEDERYADVFFNTVLETNRGCTYGCAYCYWARSVKGMRQFPIERVKKDIEWIAKNKISYCLCADSNFGIFDRDEAIADYVIEMKEKYGYPDVFETASAKNKNDLTFRINYKLEQYKLNRGVSVSVQTMSPEVLEIIGRKNMTIENFAEQLKRYRTHGMHVYTEVILGLPGETKESFCKGIFELMEAGQHYAISVYRCEVFPNTAIYSDEMRQKYKIRTISSPLCQKHSRIDVKYNFASQSQIIVETSTMNMHDWYVAQKVTMCAQSFHCMGLLRFFAFYLHKAKKVSYYDFYMNLYEWIEHESVTVKRILDRTCYALDAFMKDKGSLYFADERFGNIYWDFDDGMFLGCAAELDAFYEDVRAYLENYFEDKDVFEDLLNYQKEMIALPKNGEKEIVTNYDWQCYFDDFFDSGIIDPERKTTSLKVEKSEFDSWEDYAREVVWYGKRDCRTINRIKGRSCL